MKLKPQIRYIVTRGNDTLFKGDAVSIGEDGDLYNHNVGMWIDGEDIQAVIKGVSFRVDIGHYQRLKVEVEKHLERINAVLDKYEKEGK